MGRTVYDRKQNAYYDEQQYGEKELRFLYETRLGRLALNAVVSRRWFSSLAALSNITKGSTKKIAPFVETYGIDLQEYPPKEYASFNDFFTRAILPEKRPLPQNSRELVSPADAKLMAYSVDENSRIEVKGNQYSLASILKNEELAAQFTGGTCLVFRLTVDDYHRYIYIDDGEVVEKREIPGRLYTVGPYSEGKHRVFQENQRVYSLLETENFGRIVAVEVGALLVGKIHNHPAEAFARGQEKGYFSYGGSTILLVFQKDVVDLDSDIVSHSAAMQEVKVRMGERIGIRHG